MNDRVRKLLADLPDSALTELADVFEDLWNRRFTGKATFHFRAGYPSAIETLPHASGRKWLIRRPPS